MEAKEDKEECPSIQWLIMYCPDDESFSLIEETEAVCDKLTLELEDKLKFFYEGREWDGIVRDMGGNTFPCFCSNVC